MRRLLVVLALSVVAVAGFGASFVDAHHRHGHCRAGHPSDCPPPTTTSTTTSTTTTTTPPSTCPSIVEARSYGTNDSALRAAITKAQSCRVPLHIGAASYTYSSVLTISGIKVYGDGVSTVLTAATPSSMAITLRGTGTELRSLKIACPTCSTRLTTPQSAAVNVDAASSFVVENVTVDKAGSAGLFVYGAGPGRLTGNTVANTLADAIHITHGAHDVDVGSNTVTNAGDDMVGVVGYETDIVRPHAIVVHDNALKGQRWGRGVSVIGSYDVKVLRNAISNSYGAGVLVASEPAWVTFGVDNVEISSNVIRNPDFGNIHNANILISGLRAGYPVNTVYGSGNNCQAPKPVVRKEGSYSSITVTGFYGA